MQNDLDLGAIFQALNVAALEVKPDGRFFLLGDGPDWLHNFCEDIVSNECFLEPNYMFGFLSNFTETAKEFWAANQVGCLRSGIWIEEETPGEETLYEALAISTPNKKILVIAQDQQAHLDNRMIIQKGRELSINYRDLMCLQNETIKDRNTLEKRVKARTAELEEINAKLAHELKMRKRIEAERAAIMKELQQSQKMEAIGTLAGGIAHDFNNILSAIVGFTELSLTEIQANPPAVHKLEQVLVAAERAKSLVKQILKFSSQAKEDPKPVRMKRVVEETLTLIRASYPSTIEINCSLDSNHHVLADFTQLHQVTMNLCTNAAQSMNPSGGTITIRLSDAQVDKESSNAPANMDPGTYVQLSVKDTGCGMPPDVVERIFNPFFTTKPLNEGTGMGLSVVHGIVRSYGGGITVESAIGKGSAFHIFLPAVESVENIERDTRKKRITGDESILFVDDEPTQVELAEDTLSRLGYDVVTLTDSRTAYNQFRKEPDKFDLVVTDLTMPKMTGLILARKMLSIRPDLPIILCSGYSESIYRQEARGIGIRDFLMKPIALSDLANAIRKLLDQE